MVKLPPSDSSCQRENVAYNFPSTRSLWVARRGHRSRGDV
jgi:hypothetical protein